ncbi:hypothetical protein CXG81DRAFT_20655 [Caulochytrium protostelioides]|uniref:Histone H1 n=1 Tax=Caulochytrium protostelioides TaxID=1555241 RepID=A0A4P9X2W8_9FUNG|nr:hypothetical protein CXG81DRAFT_20655 [Caulochytrium protostelioides]|eukprot:RKO99236.1 hypothetical protein CXG81DRAFT_20655 [Caulochytrium protostelioides]
MSTAVAAPAPASAAPKSLTYKQMVVEALLNVKDRKGPSRASIKKYILATFPATNENSVDQHLAKTLKAGEADGSFVKPVPASPRYKLSDAAKTEATAKKTAVKKVRKAAEKAPAKKTVKAAKPKAAKASGAGAVKKAPKSPKAVATAKVGAKAAKPKAGAKATKPKAAKPKAAKAAAAGAVTKPKAPKKPAAKKADKVEKAPAK